MRWCRLKRFHELSQLLWGTPLERTFTIAEANRLIPELENHLHGIRQGKTALMRTKAEIKKASSNAHLGGGSTVGFHYVQTLEQISEHLHDIQEMGVLIKDLELGLCDFPFHKEGRIVYLCWKLGEGDIRYWHEIHSGYSDRQPLEPFDERKTPEC